MGWGDIHQPRVGWKGVGDQAVFVDRHAGHVKTEGVEQPPRRRVPGIFDSDPAARHEQNPRDQVERLLRAAGDGYLPRGYRNASGHSDVGSDRSAQRRKARRIAVFATADGRGPQFGGHQAAPRLKREPARIDQAGAELIAGRGGESRRDRDTLPDRPGTQHATGCVSRGFTAGNPAADERARTHP